MFFIFLLEVSCLPIFVHERHHIISTCRTVNEDLRPVLEYYLESPQTQPEYRAHIGSVVPSDIILHTIFSTLSEF